MCLNYELIRDDPKKPWRKKNINLKFSRMLTVFGTVLPIIAKPATTAAVPFAADFGTALFGFAVVEGRHLLFLAGPLGSAFGHCLDLKLSP